MCAVQREILSASPSPVRFASHCESCDLSVQPVLRWTASIAWLLRVVYSVQHGAVFLRFQNSNDQFNSLHVGAPCWPDFRS